MNTLRIAPRHADTIPWIFLLCVVSVFGTASYGANDVQSIRTLVAAAMQAFSAHDYDNSNKLYGEAINAALGIKAGPDKMAMLYHNRAVVRETAKDLSGAESDYREAIRMRASAAKLAPSAELKRSNIVKLEEDGKQLLNLLKRTNHKVEAAELEAQLAQLHPSASLSEYEYAGAVNRSHAHVLTDDEIISTIRRHIQDNMWNFQASSDRDVRMTVQGYPDVTRLGSGLYEAKIAVLLEDIKTHASSSQTFVWDYSVDRETGSVNRVYSAVEDVKRSSGPTLYQYSSGGTTAPRYSSRSNFADGHSWYNP